MYDLDHNRIGSDGCFYISKTNLPRLETLDLSHNLINANAAGHLANTNLPKLIHLIISTSRISKTTMSLQYQPCIHSVKHIGRRLRFFKPKKTSLSLPRTPKQSNSELR